MPVPTSPVRPVPTTPRRVRTWLPPLGLTLAAALVAAGVGLTPDGTEAAGRVLAWGLVRWGAEPSCERPWLAWSAVVRGARPASEFVGCAAEIGDVWWRRVTLQRVALHGGPGQVQAARLLLEGASPNPAVLVEVVIAAPAAARRAQIDPQLLAISPLDLGRLLDRFPAGGLYDRALLLRDADPRAAARELLPVLAELDAMEQGWASVPAAESGRPGSELEPPQPARRPPPLLEGVLVGVPESARDHVFSEWLHLLDFVRRAPDRPPAATPEARWALVAETVREGNPTASVHAALRGDPVLAPVAAWVLASLARDAGLAVTARRSDHDIQLAVGETTLWFGRAGGRWQGPPDPGAPEVAITVLREEALAALPPEGLNP